MFRIDVERLSQASEAFGALFEISPTGDMIMEGTEVNPVRITQLPTIQWASFVNWFYGP